MYQQYQPITERPDQIRDQPHFSPGHDHEQAQRKDDRQRHPIAHARELQRIARWQYESQAEGIGEDSRNQAEPGRQRQLGRSEEHTSELQSLMRNSYAVFCLNKKNCTTVTKEAQSRS